MKGMRLAKSGVFGMMILAICVQIACNDKLERQVTAAEQFAIDIQDMEDYLADKGIVDYDTLDISFTISGTVVSSSLRVAILEEGDGEAIEYGDIVKYNIAGKLVDDILFESSLALPAYQQDTTYADSLVLELDTDENFVLDENGLPSVEYASFEAGYWPIYTPGSPYQRYTTTHSQDGWYIINEGGYAPGFAHGVHYTLDNVNLGGKGVVLIPYLAGSVHLDASFRAIYGIGVILFEISPVSIVE